MIVFRRQAEMVWLVTTEVEKEVHWEQWIEWTCFMDESDVLG